MAAPGEVVRPARFMGRPRHRLFVVFDTPGAVGEVWGWLVRRNPGEARRWLVRENRGGDVWALRSEEGIRSLDVSGRPERS